MKIYFAGDGHNIEKTDFINKYNWDFLLSYGDFNWTRFLWIIGKKSNLPQNIIDILVKNYENIPLNMAGRTKPGSSPE